MAAKKFTFKTTKPTGRFASFDTAYHEIKMDGKAVGTINSEEPFKVSLYVVKTDTITDNNPNCPWKRITFARGFTSLQEAKDWLNTKFEQFNKDYTIHQE